MFVCINGKFLKKKDAKISVFDNGFLYGDGIYETIRIYDGVIFELDEHLKRLQKSAEITGLEIKWPIAKIMEWANKLVKLNKGLNRMRITVSRGENGLDFNSCENPTLVIHCEKLRIDPEIYKKGVSAVTFGVERIRPEAKTLGLMHLILSQRYILQKKAQEAIMVDEKNFVREGPSTNVFALIKGIIYTPASHILIGTTRNRILELVKKNGIKIIVKDLKIEELESAEEIFLTNKIKEIIPVTKLNGKKVGSGKVGEYTQKIMKLYKDYVKAYVRSVKNNEG
ncbi:MAG: aminotransferase class IV [Patescibacteria group bacterium]